MNRVFLLSPAQAGGQRARMLLRPGARFALARQVQFGRDAPLGEVFAFCSGLYFRGKLAYARRFAQPPSGLHGVQIITSSRGLLPDTHEVGPRELEEFAGVPVDSREPRFTVPLTASVATLARFAQTEFVLLGSVATGKYLDTLAPLLGERLRFPVRFAGLGDMSRGALLLRAVAAGAELEYRAVVPTPAQGSQRTRQSA